MITLGGKNRISVKIRMTDNRSAVKAYADVRLNFADGELHIVGFAIIKQDDKSAFVGFPQNRGKNKYFPVVDAKGDLREEIIKEILRAYERALEPHD